MSRSLRLFAVPAAILLGALPRAGADGTSQLIGNYVSPTDFTYINSAIGTDIFYSAGYLGGNTIIANVEAGNVWFGHDAFNRPAAATQPLFTYTNPSGDAVNQLDFHATAVGNALAGTGYVEGSSPDQFLLVGIGIAPYAGLWSGAIATSFSPTDFGSFSTSDASFIAPYKAFFNGINGQKPDVVNSSWGFENPAATAPETVALDGLARQNATVTFVASAGNSGTAPVGGPANGYNGISVGSVGGAGYLTPSSFSSHGLVDFYNPETGLTEVGVRAGVDIAAPGEAIALAAYLGDSGSIGASTDPEIAALVESSPSTDLYFTSLDGTSFSAPIVAGGIALLKDVAKSPAYAAALGTEALDSRVIKAVIMASATETIGWNNGQTVNEDGVIVTDQALDAATGAGALNLAQAAEVYVFGTTDVTGTTGGTIDAIGWDLGTLAPGDSNSYLFANPFAEKVELTVSLNWFAETTFNNTTDLGEMLSFSDFNLQVWQYQTGLDPRLIAESITQYNTSEFLRIELEPGALYGLTVVFNGTVFDLTSGVTSETYGLAWQAVAVPEPATTCLVFASLVLFVRRRR